MAIDIERLARYSSIITEFQSGAEIVQKAVEEARQVGFPESFAELIPFIIKPFPYLKWTEDDKLVAFVNGEERPLTRRRTETTILLAFNSHFQQRPTFFLELHELLASQNESNPRSMIREIRKTIEEDPHHPQRLVNIFDKGYFLVSDPENPPCN